MSIINIKQKDFTLSKVKVLKEGVEAHFKSKRAIGKQVAMDTIKFESDDLPHEDLLNAMNDFKEPIALSVGASSEGDIADSIKVTGISFSGNKNQEVFIVTGGFTTDMGYSGINTPNIKLVEKAKHGLNVKDYQQKLDTLRAEVFEYIVNMKRAQATIFDVQEGDKKEEKTESKKLKVA